MKRLMRLIKRLVVPLCIILCAAALAGGVYALTTSGREITMSLHRVDGDITGIRGLRITGEVKDDASGLSYVFACDGADGAPVGLDPWARLGRGTDDYWPFVDETSVTLRAVSGVREEITPETGGEDDGYDLYYPALRRVYADVFEAIPRVPYVEIPVRLDPGAEKLYYRGDADTYLEYVLPREADEYASPYPNTNVGTVTRGAMLPSHIDVGGMRYFTPALDRLFGRTAVYVTDIPEEGYELGPDEDYPARELLPIRLREDVDEICGFLTCEDALLLAVRYGDEMELTRLLPGEGPFPSVRIPAGLDLEHPLKNDGLMLFTSESGDGLSVDYRVLDTSAMRIAASGDKARIGGGQGHGEGASLFTLHAFCLGDGALYIGSDSMMPRIPGYDYRRRQYITALSLTGRRQGCAEVMVGISDDPDLPYEQEFTYFGNCRYLKSLDLSDGGFYD